SRSCVAQDVIEEEVVIRGESTANHSLVFSGQAVQETRCKSWRVCKAKARCPVVVIALLLYLREKRLAQPHKRWIRHDIKRCAIVFVSKIGSTRRSSSYPSPVLYE